LAKGRADLGFKWNLAATVIQIPGLYLGAKLGGTVGVAIAFSILMAIHVIFIYLILIRTVLGPCLSEYIQSMWPSLWMSGATAVAVFAAGLLFQSSSQPVVLIIQVLCGAVVYLGLMFCNQKMLLVDIKNMAVNRGVAVDK
jgi:PST family polysaccharide transporter/lipopolysaccharide exporter